MKKPARERTGFGHRMAKARAHRGLSQRAVAMALGVSQGTVSEAETTAEGSAHVTRFASLYGVNADWLATGEGEMLDLPPGAFGITLSEAARQLATAFHALPDRPEKLRLFHQMMHMMLEQGSGRAATPLLRHDPSPSAGPHRAKQTGLGQPR